MATVPTGQVTIKVDGTQIAFLNLTNGQANENYTIPNSLAVGNHTVEADYSGDNLYPPASATAPLTVQQGAALASVALTVSPSAAAQGASVAISITVSGNM